MFTEGPEEIVSQYQGEQNPTSWIKTWKGAGETRDEADVHHRPGNRISSTAPKDRHVETPKKEGVCDEVRTMLKYFCRKSDILWFEDVPELQDLVIPQPMAFVASLRSVISHDVCDKLKQLQGGGVDKEEKDIKYKGTMSYKTFVKIFNQSEEHKFSPKQVWQFLVHLGLAIPINDMDKEPRILVPSLISDETKATMMERADFKDDTLSLQYVFAWDHMT